ncbi:MAG: glycosyl hydrolase family 28-related protein [Puniceicoccales bacterium]
MIKLPHHRLAGFNTFSNKLCTGAFVFMLGLGSSGCQASEATAAASAKDAEASASTDSWRTELYPEDWTPPTEDFVYSEDEFIQDFSYAGYARGEKPIPDFADAKVFNVLDYGADPTGKTDSTAAIQKAIDSAVSLKNDTVVLLPAGTYHIQPQGDEKCALRISGSNIVLRGEGPDKTFLLNTSYEMRGKQIIRVQGDSKGSWKEEGSPSTTLSWDLLGPTKVIPVDDASGFKVGDTIVISMTPTPEWIAELGEEDGWGGFEHKLGRIMYLRRIQSVDTQAGEITIDIPTRYALKVRDNVKVFAKGYQLYNVGLEDFSIANAEHPGQDGWEVLDFADADSAYTKRLVEGYNLDPDFAKKRKSASTRTPRMSFPCTTSWTDGS